MLSVNFWKSRRIIVFSTILLCDAEYYLKSGDLNVATTTVADT